MNSKSIGLLLGLVALAALSYLVLGSDDDHSAGSIQPLGLSPTSDTVAAADSTDVGLATPKVAQADSGGRKAVPEKISEADKRAEEKALKAAKKAEGPFLKGTVFGSDGAPVPGVKVSVEGEFGAASVLIGNAIKIAEEAVTDRRGEFQVPRGKWPIQELSVTLEARGFLVARELRSPAATSGDSTLGDFVLQRGVVLAGQVLDATGTEVVEATVRRTSVDDDGSLDGMLKIASTFGRGGDNQTKTDERGRFELLHEEPGSYLLVVEHDKYPKQRYRGEAPPEGGEDLGIVVRMDPTASITGRILNYPEGRTGVSVQATLVDEPSGGSANLAGMMGLDASQGVKVSTSGTFEIHGLDVGRKYSVKATVQEGIFARTACSETEEVLSGTGNLELDWNAGARVRFSVEDIATGKPLGNLVVRHRWEDSRSGIIPGAAKKLEVVGNRVEISELRPATSPGKLEFSVYAEGYLEERVSGIEVRELDTIDLDTVRLRVAPLVRVQVVDSTNGDPVRKARVVLSPQDDEESELIGMYGERSAGRTDGDGWCELPACSTPLATLSVKKGGYASYEREDVRMPEEGTIEEIARLFTGGTIEVQVLDAERMPAPEINVSHRLPDESTRRHQTNSKGIVRLTDLEAGEHSFRAERPRSNSGRRGRRNVRVSFDDNEAEEAWHTVVLSNGGEAEVQIELPPTALVQGIVLLRGQPVAQARVMLVEGEESSAADELSARMSERMSRMMPDAATSTRTNTQGRFELTDAPLGKHRIRVARDDGSPAFHSPVTLREGKNQVEIDMPSAGVEGRVVDSEGKPVAGASVETLRATKDDAEAESLAQMEMAMSFFGGGQAGGIRTDYDGRFLIEGVPTDVPLVVRASANGYSRGQSEPITVKERELQRGVKVVLTASGSIRVLTDDSVARFQPITAKFEGEGEDKPGPKMALTQSGQAVIRGLKPGRWRVYLNRNEDGFQIVEVHAGEQATVTLGL